MRPSLLHPLQGRLTLRHLAHLPEVASVVRGACALKPAARPPVAPVLAHLLWWDPPRRLAFLIDISDRVEGEDRAVSGPWWWRGSVVCERWVML